MAGFAARHSITSIDHHDTPATTPRGWGGFFRRFRKHKPKNSNMKRDSIDPVEIHTEGTTVSRFSVTVVDDEHRISTASTSGGGEERRDSATSGTSERRDSNSSSGRRLCRDSFGALSLT